MRYLFVIVLLEMLLLLLPACSKRKKTDYSKPPKYAQEQPFKSEGKLWFFKAYPKDTLSVIDIEIADDDASREKGLMYRKSMDTNQGMLFIFDREEIQSFWMHNTYIPLDIIFIDRDFKIIHIAGNTVPFSVRSVSSIKPSMYVVEVNAGYCEKMGISEGCRIKFLKY